MNEKPTIAAEKMLRILREHSRIVEHYDEPEERVPLLLNSEDMCAAKVYTHEEVNQLREHFVSDAPHVSGKLPVYFWKQDISEHIYKSVFKEWEYSRDSKRVSTLIFSCADTRRPGGNIFCGGQGQEERLCENSTLLASLESVDTGKFYRMQQAAPEGMGCDAMVLSPYVEFFGVEGIQRKTSDIAAVLSAAVPSSGTDETALKETLYRRIRGMLHVAAREGYKHLVFGPWGCEDGGLDPETAASAIEAALRESISVIKPNGEKAVISYRWRDFFDSVTFALPNGKAADVFKAHFSDFYRAEREAKHQKIRDSIAEDRKKYLSSIMGCLIGGAVGDALGYPVEFMPYDSIAKRYGEKGIIGYDKDNNTGLALISDDTQMTLFTATGLLVGYSRMAVRGIADSPEGYIFKAYRDWYVCQWGEKVPKGDDSWLSYGHPRAHYTSWLCDLPEMHQQRAPGTTCISAIRSGDYGTIYDPINTSKGCGGIMRIAPIALYSKGEKTYEQLVDICYIAANTAALTHGHPLGHMPAAALAHILSRGAFGGCPYGNDLHGFLRECGEMMADMFDDEAQTRWLPRMLSLMKQAETLAANDRSDVENIHSLGGGWVAEETLAIAIYCCVRYADDFSKAVIAAVNHSGDSDSTGAVAGNIMGALLGYEKIDPAWLDDLELRAVVEEIAADLCDGCRMSEYSDYSDKDWERKYLEFGNYGQDPRDVE